MTVLHKEIINEKPEGKEEVKVEVELGKIYNGDCKFVLRHDLLERGVKVDLIYLDPPFFTGKTRKGKVEMDDEWNPAVMQVSYEDSKKFWHKEREGLITYPEWIKHIAVKRPAFASYLYYMMERLRLCRRILKDTGSIYLHCDYRASHYLKMIMDEVFGVENFKNEIIWSYSGGGVPKRAFARKHDVLLFYTKSDKYTFNIEYKPYAPSTSRHTNGTPLRKEGTPLTDNWDDLRGMSLVSKERLGYPTQKPLKLLKRIIKASSNEGDVVLDPFCGCGTAIVSAQKLGRKWIGIDIEPDACKVMQKRFEKEFSFKPKITWRLLEQVKEIKEGLEFQEWVNEFYHAEPPRPDGGVDGITFDGVPIQTKTWKVGYEVVDRFLNNFKYHHVKKINSARVAIIVSQEGFKEKAIARVFEIKNREGIEILLRTPEQLLEA